MGWNAKRLPLRLSLILPIAQVALAIFLLGPSDRPGVQQRWDTLYGRTAKLVCAGINAPATIFIGFARMFDRVDHPQPTVFGLSLEFVFFLLGIGLLWYFVGRFLDQKLLPTDRPRVWSRNEFIFIGGAFAVYGLVLLSFGLQGFLTPWQWNNYWGNAAHAVLLVIWALVLLAIPAVKLVRLRRMQKG
jgi:hypothetical protein